MACQSKIVVREHSVHQQVKFTLQWTVEGILLHRYDTAMMLNAGVTMAELGMTDWVGRWRTGLQVCRVDPEHPGVDGYSLAAYLFLTDMDLESRSYTGPHTIRAGCQISVATGKTMRQIVSPTDWLSTRLSNTATSHGRHKVISHRDLFDKLEDDSITVTLDVSVETTVDSFRVRSRPLNHELYRQQFCQRLTDLLHGHPEQHPADFVIRSRDGQNFSVHRFLLMAHSPVFAAMLTHDS
ncbi:uncharacterized protein LOC129594679 [Paramacrobiotus metropolitanus]|uniref:uncharacterized protein LOC129594679 n=1 Tax=Paramacrobiotus metropolitanus TaxID=2943436 RepID=UPI0024458E26|nr:uncharacterized protein LOC129594679 [Paramacrobiotus metropolitanus]